ncbi:MAG TPA: DUF177 domain-containing protein [Acidimicrobiales bacterium]|nr:DUF177 domain-containing protein [Acidimicrobiales bacterium]
MATGVVDPFIIALGELRDTHGARRHELRRGRLNEAVVADLDSRVPAGAEAVVDVTLEAFDGGVEVSGSVSAPWEGECRRCLASLDGGLEAGVRELFRRGGGEEDGTYPLGEDQINLRDMVVDALFAVLPVLPLCKDDCRGICPNCGADRNLETCSCPEVAVDERWAGTRALVQDDPHGG